MAESKLFHLVPIEMQARKYLPRYCTQINPPTCKLNWLFCKAVSSKQ